MEPDDGFGLLGFLVGEPQALADAGRHLGTAVGMAPEANPPVGRDAAGCGFADIVQEHGVFQYGGGRCRLAVAICQRGAEPRSLIE